MGSSKNRRADEMKKLVSGVIAFSLLLVCGLFLYSLMGSGGFKRMTTITGIYSVCRPDKYEVVCFLDADSKDGGLFCMPLSIAGGECKK